MNKDNQQHEWQASRWMLPLLVVATLAASACIGSSDDDGQPSPPPTPADSASVVIDSTFFAPANYLVGEWMTQQGGYQGYDPMQSDSKKKDVVSSIRRLVLFTTDGQYDSHVQGIVDVSDSTFTEYREFEHEHGTYVYDAVRHAMTYTVEYDSVLDFQADKLKYYPAKLFGERERKKQYDEVIWFSAERDGRRDWIRVDDNLMVVDNHEAHVVYIMKNQ